MDSAVKFLARAVGIMGMGSIGKVLIVLATVTAAQRRTKSRVSVCWEPQM